MDFYPNSTIKNFSYNSLTENQLRNNKKNKDESNKVKVLKDIEDSLLKYVPPILMATGVNCCSFEKVRKIVYDSAF